MRYNMMRVLIFLAHGAICNHKQQLRVGSLNVFGVFQLHRCSDSVHSPAATGPRSGLSSDVTWLLINESNVANTRCKKKKTWKTHGKILDKLWPVLLLWQFSWTAASAWPYRSATSCREVYGIRCHMPRSRGILASQLFSLGPCRSGPHIPILGHTGINQRPRKERGRVDRVVVQSWGDHHRNALGHLWFTVGESVFRYLLKSHLGPAKSEGRTGVNSTVKISWYFLIFFGFLEWKSNVFKPPRAYCLACAGPLTLRPLARPRNLEMADLRTKYPEDANVCSEGRQGEAPCRHFALAAGGWGNFAL